jgi:hypothetical protein
VNQIFQILIALCGLALIGIGAAAWCMYLL